MKEKLEAFRALVEAQQKARMVAEGYDLAKHGNNYDVTVKPKAKYTYVDIGSSGRYIVVNETGEIFGIKAYGVIHRGHAYGTLDTIGDWSWGGYYPVKHNQNIYWRDIPESVQVIDTGAVFVALMPEGRRVAFWHGHEALEAMTDLRLVSTKGACV